MSWGWFSVAAWPHGAVMEEMEAATAASNKRARESLENPLDWVKFSVSLDLAGPLLSRWALLSGVPRERGVSSVDPTCDRTRTVLTWTWSA